MIKNMSKDIFQPKTAQDIITSLDQDDPPIQVVPIANKMGINVYAVYDWKQQSISGMIRKHKKDGGDSGYAIYVNADHSTNRRRFTIAHELGHYVLHKNLIGDGLLDDALYRSGLSNLIESEANRFAADILMPKAMVRAAIAKEDSIERLAEQFEVSPQAMAIRLQVPHG